MDNKKIFRAFEFVTNSLGAKNYKFSETNQKTDRPWIDLIDYNHESFRPIGWSKDGKFAFLINGIGEGTGCPYFALKIIALNVNKKIWDLSVIVGDSCENEESIWNQHRTEIEKNLRANQIIQHNNFEFVKDLEKLPKIVNKFGNLIMLKSIKSIIKYVFTFPVVMKSIIQGSRLDYSTLVTFHRYFYFAKVDSSQYCSFKYKNEIIKFI